ncbi:CoB--CoM heterodisulfide reductase iron-sulfur subunit B family protein [bacterium]|nr:CoB--CoM heterodisulfide reductase iron-sulfur subunit B family protein [bacterium]
MTEKMSYTFYPGCSLHSTARDYRESSEAVCAALGVELVELPDWVCCGATAAHATNEKLALALPLENLSRAAEVGRDVVVACAACFNRFRVANLAVRNDRVVRAEMEEIVGRPYDGSLRVRHILEILLHDVGLVSIRRHVRKSLRSLKVACYYGCLLARPREVSIFDDPENPRLMDDCMDAIGAEPIEWPHKTECCGAAYSLTNPDMAIRLSGDILFMAKEAGADCVAVACPLCQSNLDLRQRDIERQRNEVLGLPVFYFTQLMGIAFGLSERSLGIQRLVVNPVEVLKRIAEQSRSPALR